MTPMARRPRVPGALLGGLLLLGLALPAGCSDGDPAGNPSDDTDPGAAPDDTRDPLDGQPDTGAGLPDGRVPDTPVEALTVNTVLSDNGPAAGQEIHVFCEVEGLAEGQEAPATVWELWQQPADVPHEPTLTAETITFYTVGSYEVRCLIAETSWTDPTAAKAKVHAGEALDVDTLVDEEHPAAGDVVEVTCVGEDAWGNVVEQEWKVEVAPGGPAPGIADGVVLNGMQIKALTVGSYEVACRQGEGGKVDPTPAVLLVQHGLPKVIVTTLDEPSIPAGGATAVSCHAEDKFGNVVPDLPMAIDLPSLLALAGFDVTGTVTGTYVVKCVPVQLDWTAFSLETALLEIVPGPPVMVEVDLLPPKPFFSTYEQITLLVSARDAWDNPIPDAPIEEIEVTPGEADYKFTGDTTVLFKEEGFFTLTVRLLEDPSIWADVDVAIDGAPPTVTVTNPLRGATVQNSKPSVTIEGLANDTVTGIASVKVNDIEATMHDDGTWTVILIPSWGLNVIHVVAEDEDGNLSQVTQSFYFAELYYAMEPEAPYIPDAIKAWIDDKFIDDGIHNPTQPDDLATILEGVMASLDLNALLGDKIELGSDYWLELKGVSFNPPKLSLDPFDGGLHLIGEIKNFYIAMKFVCEIEILGIDICPDFSGSVSVGVLALVADLYAAAKNKVLDVAMGQPDVTLQAIDVDGDGILGWLFDWLIDFLVGIFTGTIEDTIESQMGALLDDTLTEVFGALEFSQTLEMDPLFPGMDPISLTLEIGLHTLTFSEEGGRLGLGSALLATKKVPQQIHGSIARGTCVKGYPTGWQVPGESSFEGALYDDLMNLALTTIWYNGILNLKLGQDVFDELLGGEGGEDLPIPIDSMNLDMTMLLPPIINGCDPDGLLMLQIGDIFMDIDIDSVLFGGASEIGVYLSAELAAEIILTETDEGAAIGLMLHGVERLDYEWAYVPELFEGSEEVLEEIIEDQLLGAALEGMTGDPVFEFVIPEIDLGELSELFPPGSLIDPEIEDMYREGGHTLLQGHLE